MSKLLISVLVVFTIFSCGTSRHLAQDKYIKVFDVSRSENFTNDQLRNLMKQPGYMPSIVVRDISGASTSVSGNSNAHRLCSILEMSLAKNQMDVRDRGLFDNVLASAKKGDGYLDYSKMYEVTQVDLLMEISSYDLNIPYYVDKYYVGETGYFFPPQVKLVDGKKVDYHPTYVLRGMSITIKVIMLQNNLIGGTYSFTYVPCSAENGGALITQLSPLRYRPVDNNRDIDAVLSDTRQSEREYSSNEKLDILMEDYLTNSVVPDLLAYMRGETVHSEQATQQSTSPSGSMNKQVSYNTDNKKDSFLEAKNRMNKSTPVENVPEINKNSKVVQDLKGELLLTGLYSEEEIEKMIQDQVNKNYELIQTYKGVITNTLQQKEKWMIKLKSSTSEKDIAKYKRKIALIDAELERLGYYNFNDYSSLDKEIKTLPAVADLVVAKDVEDTKHSDSSEEGGEEMESDIRLVNSYGDLSSAISSMIASQFDVQAKEEIAAAKKSKADKLQADLQKMDTDLKKLDYLEEDKHAEINKFVGSVTYAVGEKAPASDNAIIFFFPSFRYFVRQDAIYVFLDGNCVGCGTSKNGVYASIPTGDLDDGFHDVTIVSSPMEDSKEQTVLFNSSVMFKIKKEYIFDGILKGGNRRLTSLILK